MKIQVAENDAGGFIEQVEACANGVVRTLNPRECILVRINNWFGPKWLPFSAPTTKPDEGIAAKNLSLPLFVPNRVVAQCNFLAPTYTEYMGRKSVHVQVRTPYARQRLMSDLPSDTAIVWYSGNSKVTGRGSLLVYLPMGERYHAWYAGWFGNGAWRVVLTKGTAVQDLARFIQAGSTNE